MALYRTKASGIYPTESSYRDPVVSKQDPYERETYPVLIVLSGPSGVGKDTIAKGMLDQRPDDFYFVVTATDRKPRENEVHGRDYFFVSTAEFDEMIGQGELLEYANVYGNYKGIPKQQVREALASGRDVIVRVDVQGAATVRKIVPNSILVFITTATETDMITRLTERNTEKPDELEKRIKEASEEMQRIEEFDYCVVNPSQAPHEAVAHVLSIVDAAHCAVRQSPVIL